MDLPDITPVESTEVATEAIVSSPTDHTILSSTDPSPPRYPARNRKQPDRLAPYVTQTLRKEDCDDSD